MASPSQTVAENNKSSTIMNENHFTLPSELLTRGDIDRISKLCFSGGSKKRRRSKTQRPPVRAIVCPVISKTCFNTWTSTGEYDVSSLIDEETTRSLKGHQPVRLSRYPEAIFMKLRSLTFGRGISNDVPLDLFTSCNFISPKHAVLFYDELDQQFELLNYSCYGTYVDENLAANHETAVMRPLRSPDDDWMEFRKIKMEDECDQKVYSPEDRFATRCTCNPVEYEKLHSGWEGSLTVKNGSVLRFGCASFIFFAVDDNE